MIGLAVLLNTAFRSRFSISTGFKRIHAWVDLCIASMVCISFPALLGSVFGLLNGDLLATAVCNQSVQAREDKCYKEDTRRWGCASAAGLERRTSRRGRSQGLRMSVGMRTVRLMNLIPYTTFHQLPSYLNAIIVQIWAGQLLPQPGGIGPVRKRPWSAFRCLRFYGNEVLPYQACQRGIPEVSEKKRDL